MLYIIGLARSGSTSLAEALRRSGRYDFWIKEPNILINVESYEVLSARWLYIINSFASRFLKMRVQFGIGNVYVNHGNIELIDASTLYSLRLDILSEIIDHSKVVLILRHPLERLISHMNITLLSGHKLDMSKPLGDMNERELFHLKSGQFIHILNKFKDHPNLLILHNENLAEEISSERVRKFLDVSKLEIQRFNVSRNELVQYSKVKYFLRKIRLYSLLKLIFSVQIKEKKKSQETRNEQVIFSSEIEDFYKPELKYYEDRQGIL